MLAPPDNSCGILGKALAVRGVGTPVVVAPHDGTVVAAADLSAVGGAGTIRAVSRDALEVIDALSDVGGISITNTSIPTLEQLWKLVRMWSHVRGQRLTEGVGSSWVSSMLRLLREKSSLGWGAVAQVKPG